MESDPLATRRSEAADSLNAAIAEYTERCRALGESLLGQRTSPQGLSTWANSSIESFEQQVSLARSRMAITRNRVVSPICRVPDEVLFEIFTLVVYTPNVPPDRMHYPIGESLIDIYRSLYNLLGVCSKWRNLAFSRGSLWSIVPVMKPAHAIRHEMAKRHPCSTRLSLERAGDADLRLGVVLPYLENEDMHDLSKLVPRFRAVNISCRAHCVFRYFLNFFLENPSRRLAELSVFFDPGYIEFDDIPEEDDYVFRSEDPKQLLFEQVVKSLSILRVRGAKFHLGAAMSSSRLVELHLQELSLGRDSELIELLTTLSSVASLRHLGLISVTTFPNHEVARSPPSLSFVGLQTLWIQNLYSNTLHLLLSIISSRTHHTTLYLTNKGWAVPQPGAPELEIDGISGLNWLSGCSSVNTLMINWRTIDWATYEDLQIIVGLMSNLETLRTFGWLFSKQHCKGFTRPQSSGSKGPSFPRLRNLHFYSSMIDDTESFKAMVASHSESLEWMILGAGMEKDTYGELEWEDFEEEDEIIVWLQGNVPKFEHILWMYNPPESEDKPEWQLW